MDLKSVVDHIFLPPQLPQTEDTGSDLNILHIAVDALKILEEVANFAPNAIRNARFALSTIESSDSPALRRKLSALEVGKTTAVYVKAQNAGVLITRQEQNQLVFEQFELSPDNKAVYASPGRLVRTFPASSIAIDASMLQKDDFATMIADTLSTMTDQEVSTMKPESRKAGRNHTEDRDSARPEIISELFFGVLKGIGSPYQATSISKNTREEVLWNNARRPWRRTPIWLMIRVVLQLIITRSKDGSRSGYKNVMLLIMTHVLNTAHHHELSSELYYIMHAKLDRRRQKLLATASLDPSIAKFVETALQKSFAKLSGRWSDFQASDVPNIDWADFKSLEFEVDSDVELRDLSTYILNMKNRQSSGADSQFTPSTKLLKSDPDNLPRLPKSVRDEYAAPNLQQFEVWVADCLQAWTHKHRSDDACMQLSDLTKEYHSLAQVLYRNNPEQTSAMLLTVLELWVACDQAAVRGCAWLADYDVDIPAGLLQNLLLPHMSQMHRLSSVESYLASRKGKLSSSLLLNSKSSQSFAACYYDSSESHQLLHQSITSRALVAKQEKLAELRRIQQEYDRLDTLHRQTPSCQYITVIIDRWCDPPETKTSHSGSCNKCTYKKQRDDLSIAIHEWPLPADKVAAKAVVFELQPPDWFVHWRDARLYLLNQVLNGKRPKTGLRSDYRLSSNDPHLTQYFNGVKNKRVELLSQDKPMIVTHYASLKDVSRLSEWQVCVPNGLDYSYYDSITSNFVGDFAFDDTTPKSCTYILPYNMSALQRFMFRPAAAPDGEPPNAVIASQETCPSSMTLEEFKDLSSIPLGHHLQWSNINLQLAMPSVDFKKLETTLLFLQCIYQVGPPGSDGDAHRESHHILKCKTIVLSILENLHLALSRIKQNWESVQALNTLVAIAARVLSLNGTAKASCMLFLRTARKVAVNWISTLREKAHDVKDHAVRCDLISRAVQVALVCASTFDVDSEHLRPVLSCPEDAKDLAWVSIVIQEGEHVTSKATSHVAVLALRFKRLLHRCYHVLAQNGAGIDAAVRMAWSAYKPSNKGWHSVSAAADHWITTSVAAGVSGTVAQVHFNLLTGELLVNGLPLDQPPSSYRENSLFRTLFGHSLVEVMPTSEPGFQFSTKRLFGGYQVQLGMEDGELLVRAVDQSGAYEIVPSRVLHNRYPLHFSDDFVLWYDISKSLVELRPAKDPWNSQSTGKWTLSQKGSANVHWNLAKDGATVVGTGLRTSSVLSQTLAPLALESRIHCILHPGRDVLHAEIPSLRLKFSLASSTADLRCLEYPSTTVDHDQSLGTLIGFANKLMLKSEKTGERMVLVLAAPLSYSRRNDHVSVEVQRQRGAKVYAIGVDSQLKRLVHGNNIDCKLYMAYAHALTSFCLPDPSTLKTGTEEALDILRSKAVESFEQLSQANIDMLQAIARLSPRRQHYPAHERVMQQVDWDSRLTSLSQHGEFAVVVESLFQQSQSMSVFYPDHKVEFPRLEDAAQVLRQKDAIQSSSFRVFGYGAESHTTAHDRTYTGRDRGLNSALAQQVSTVAGLLTRDSHDIHWAAANQGHLWSLMQKYATVLGVNSTVQASRLGYDSSMLQTGFESAVTTFLALHRWLGDQGRSRQHAFKIIMWLGTLAFDSKTDTAFLQVLISCFKAPGLATIRAPGLVSYSPKGGYDAVQQIIKTIVHQHQVPFASSSEFQWPRNINEKLADYNTRRQHAWQRACEAVTSSIVAAILAQWPRETASTPAVANASTYVDLNSAMSAINKHFETWYRNRLLHGYMGHVGREMSLLSRRSLHLSALSQQPPVRVISQKGYISEQDLFSGTPPSLPRCPPVLSAANKPRTRSTTQPKAEPRLSTMIQRLTSAAGQSSHELRYASDLDESLQSLVLRVDDTAVAAQISRDTLLKYVDRCELHVEQVYEHITAAMCAMPNAVTAASILHMPRMSPKFLIKQLARHRWSQLSPGWQSCVVKFSLALTALQRAQRLIILADPSRKEDFLKEIRNVGHINWDPMQYPETLLMEVESGFLVRGVQEQVASEMRQPTLKANEVLQLNMGAGKSSVIVPMVAANLANGSQLVRVIVAKPQSKQMAQMLIAKVGGLVDRRIYYMPFSRSLPLSSTIARLVAELLHECMENGGILLVQPEHILSFKLMGLGSYIDGVDEVGRSLVTTQDFLDRSSRDIVDESDENYSTRFELIYTMGTQRSIELSPDRWFLVQQVLELLRNFASHIEEIPGSIEIVSGVQGSCPRIRILRPGEDGPRLISRLASMICEKGVDGFHLSRHPEPIRQAVHRYVTEASLTAKEVEAVESSPVWSDATRSHLLMLRGLLAGGVLVFALSQKRWRVNYGLATRTPPTALAVPYRAKDSPSPRSEFSHPDVVIMLTSLSYYYGGLSEEDLFAALGHLADSDEADTEYQRWVKDSCNLPIAFKQMQSINLKDRSQCIDELFPCLKYGKSVVDFFLSHLVFPKQMKEFPHKLSASGWDIGKQRDCITTGFSGTIDSRLLLPTDVHYLDVPEQKHTNALVLEYLLMPENGVHIMSTGDQTTSEATQLLSAIMQLDPPVQVILDVGAQILELANLQMAEAWLALHDGKDAAVFVDDDDEICVVDRSGRVEMLRMSSYQGRLDRCLIFLDESHTRGIDLQLPASYRAAVTLGPKLTKDRLVQACMRMRKLCKGQTVVFCVPEEIQNKILEAGLSSKASSIEAADVLIWAIGETHDELRRCMPLWAVQGERFVRQEDLWQKVQNTDRLTTMTQQHASKFLEDEAETLENRYRPRRSHDRLSQLKDRSDTRCLEIVERCRTIDDLKFDSSTLQEEQERELSPEIEQERQIQRAPPASPAKHKLHPDVEKFAATGQLVTGSQAYRAAFSSLKETTAGKRFAVDRLGVDGRLLVTMDFADTVQKTGKSYRSDAFLRSTQWVLTCCTKDSKTIDCVMIISPYEANHLVPRMATSKTVTLHIYKPRVNSGYAPLDTLDFQTIPVRNPAPSLPRGLATQLNIFAGQLYITSYEDYLEICTFLGLSPHALTKEMESQGWQVDTDEFVRSDQKGRVGGTSGLKSSPVTFLKALMTSRRNGDGVAKTHMGKLLAGGLFVKSDFQD